MEAFFARFDPRIGSLAGITPTERRLSGLCGCFADADAYAAALAQDDPVIYHIAAVAPAEGDGQLHYAIATLMPGRIGAEYFLTKGHLHAWRAAAELYVGLCGEGLMLLEDEATGHTQVVPLTAHSLVYVPGFTAHRTINTGGVPLTYIGVYPAAAGHDYTAIAERNFRSVVVAVEDRPAVLERAAYLRHLVNPANTEHTRAYR
jgi:glucose-6-phosphate isomerase